MDFFAFFRHAAYFVNRILKGANPADLPIERASKFQFILNRKAAKALGFEVPQSILLRADEVIEWLAMSAIGTKRTCLFALQMSAYDPKRTMAPRHVALAKRA